MTEDVIKVGDYIVIQKQSYKKLHKFNKANSSVSLGRDSVNLTGIEGCPYYSVFRMIPKSKKGKEYGLERTNEATELKDEIEIKVSGKDNRNIIDDGRSQKLTAAEIAELANDAKKASDIVETLISNSSTFHSKTEYSQEKYLKKKEKKYFEYIEILKPNLRLISEIMYKLDPGKIQNIRIDTLSQIITMSNIHSEGLHLLYDSGSNGLIPAALLSVIGANTNAKLVHMHPGNMSQKQALLGMNFSQEQLSRCISVNIYSALRQYYQGIDTHDTTTSETKDGELKHNTEENVASKTNSCKPSSNTHENEASEMKGIELNCDIHETVGSEIKDSKLNPNTDDTVASEAKENGPNPLKRKAEDVDDNINKVPKLETQEIPLENPPTSSNVTNMEISAPVDENKTWEPKKPKWHFDNIAASEILKEKVDSLIIVCKEDPLNIFKELFQFVKPGRPFVIYYSVAEPLQNLYIELKSNSKVAALKLTCNWLRNYQVLPERTHPEVTMNNQSGFLLTGYILQ